MARQGEGRGESGVIARGGDLEVGRLASFGRSDRIDDERVVGLRGGRIEGAEGDSVPVFAGAGAGVGDDQAI